MRNEDGAGGSIGPSGRNAKTRASSLVSRSAPNQLRGRLGLLRTSTVWTSQFGSLLCQLYSGLPLLPELALQGNRPYPGSTRDHQRLKFLRVSTDCKPTHLLRLFLRGRSGQPDAARSWCGEDARRSRHHRLLGDCWHHASPPDAPRPGTLP